MTSRSRICCHINHLLTDPRKWALVTGNSLVYQIALGQFSRCNIINLAGDLANDCEYYRHLQITDGLTSVGAIDFCHSELGHDYRFWHNMNKIAGDFSNFHSIIDFPWRLDYWQEFTAAAAVSGMALLVDENDPAKTMVLAASSNSLTMLEFGSTETLDESEKMLRASVANDSASPIFECTSYDCSTDCSLTTRKINNLLLVKKNFASLNGWNNEWSCNWKLYTESWHTL